MALWEEWRKEDAALDVVNYFILSKRVDKLTNIFSNVAFLEFFFFLSFLADVSGIDWMVRHGRSLALSVAVNVAPYRLCSPKYYNSVQEMILSNATADRVSTT